MPFAAPEWGILDTDAWGSVDPEFITQSRNAFQAAARSASGLACESHFDGSTAFNCRFTLHDLACSYNYHATQAARYQSLWSRPYDTGPDNPSPSTSPSTPPNPNPGGNLVLGRPTASSSNFAAGYTSAETVDGNATTRWSSQYADPQWMSVDLGSAKQIGSVVLK